MTRTPQSHTLDLPGCTIHYEVYGDLHEPGQHPVLLAIGFPMDAGGFKGMASRIDDRVVVTYDPRGVGRSVREPADHHLLVPTDHAEDLAVLVDALQQARVDVFGSSGGAINGLAFVASHPERVRMLVAHEPPLFDDLPDREQIDAACRDINSTYLESGRGPAMAKFIRLVTHDGLIDDDYLQQPAPDPEAFGLPATDDGTRDDPMLGGSILTGPSHVLNLDALRREAARVVIAVGEDSGEGLAARGARATAAQIGLEPVEFPGDHGGFADGEYGMVGKPDEFAARLREVLSPTL